MMLILWKRQSNHLKGQAISGKGPCLPPHVSKGKSQERTDLPPRGRWTTPWRGGCHISPVYLHPGSSPAWKWSRVDQGSHQAQSRESTEAQPLEEHQGLFAQNEDRKTGAWPEAQVLAQRQWDYEIPTEGNANCRIFCVFSKLSRKSTVMYSAPAAGGTLGAKQL